MNFFGWQWNISVKKNNQHSKNCHCGTPHVRINVGVLPSLIRLGSHTMSIVDTLGPAYNEHPAITSRFLCIKIIECNVKKFGYKEHPLTTQFLLFASFYLL